MTLAIAADAEKIATHFGRCEHYVLYEIEDDTVKTIKTIESPPHEKGLMPKLLKDNGVVVLLCGGIGRRAKDLLCEYEITCYPNLKGTLDEAVEAFINNTLPKHDDVCEEHAFHGKNH